jgi:threonine aldolase
MPHSILFFDDYSEGAHPRILEALGRTNFQQDRGYGKDSFTQEAIRLIREKIKKPEAAIHFVSTGTQANLISIASMLMPYESVIATHEGHIAVHETGAIEATGHKVNVVPSVAGKITPEAIEAVIAEHIDEHMVQPRVVYISQATEVGTIYCKKELQALYQTCQAKGLYLFIDGARIGSAVVSKEADLDLEDIANYCDFFYIGGTKNGALLGEALVIIHPDLQQHFRYYMKQRGALMAKTRVITIAFLELFKDDLYFENARHAIEASGYGLLQPFSTNQIFPILPSKVIQALEEKYGFYHWLSNTAPEHSAIRLVTSWATQEEAVDSFLRDLVSVQERIGR